MDGGPRRDGQTPRHSRPGGAVPHLLWFNGARQTGAEYELLKAFQKEINGRYRTQGKHIHTFVAYIPTTRDQLIPGLLEGRGDIAAGILTVTPERLEQVDFGGRSSAASGKSR